MNDHLISVLIEDTISCLRFFPSKDINYLASGGWDKKLRLFEIKYNVLNQSYYTESVSFSSNLMNTCQFPSPILSINWLGNSGSIAAACADGSVNLVDLQKNLNNKIGQHKSGCSDVVYNDNYNILLTGGWDGALNIWDFRAPNPVASYQFNNKIYTMSYSNNLLVVGLSEVVMAYFDLDKLRMNQFQPEIIFGSHLKEQTKKVAVFNNGKGFIEGSIGGRVAVKYIDFSTPPKIDNKEANFTLSNKNDFSFRCHRKTKGNITNIYSINDISINPVYDTVCTVGGDGNFSIWDVSHKSKLADIETGPEPLTACDYNKSGELLAYASGYDWYKGACFASEYTSPKIFIHYLKKAQKSKQA